MRREDEQTLIRTLNAIVDRIEELEKRVQFLEVHSESWLRAHDLWVTKIDMREEGEVCSECGEILLWDKDEKIVYCINDWKHL